MAAKLRLLILLACVLVYADAMRVIFYPRIRQTTKRRVLRAAVGPTWPTRQIPYAFSNIIDFGFEDRDLIKTTLKQIEASLAIDGETCIEFVERDKEKDYILFFNRGDCSSGIGYQPGLNNVSLASSCLTSGTIVHEVMHRIGFDHEHSRHDRDKNIQVLFENANDLNNFRLNPSSREDIDAPYDFHSIIHYNSNAFKKDDSPTILSKIPALYSDHNEIHLLRDRLSPIDIFKIQSLYKCRTLTIPVTLKENDAIEEERIDKINKRFNLETEFNNVDSDLASRYLEKTYEMCGIDYVWPVDYPLVESKHRLYKLLCQKKKNPRGRCRYSIECNDEEAFCLRPLFKKKGYCMKFNNEKLNSISQTINDKMFEYGIKFKKGIKKIFKF